MFTFLCLPCSKCWWLKITLTHLPPHPISIRAIWNINYGARSGSSLAYPIFGFHPACVFLGQLLIDLRMICWVTTLCLKFAPLFHTASSYCSHPNGAQNLDICRLCRDDSLNPLHNVCRTMARPNALGGDFTIDSTPDRYSIFCIHRVPYFSTYPLSLGVKGDRW